MKLLYQSLSGVYHGGFGGPGSLKGRQKQERERREKRKRKKKGKGKGDKREKIDRDVNQHDERGAIQVRDEPPLLFFFLEIGHPSRCGCLRQKECTIFFSTSESGF